MAASATTRSAAASGRWGAGGATLLLVGALTAIAFALRVVGMDQSLYGDEDFTYYIVTDNDLGGVWDDVYHTSITPPLHYVLAWLSLQFGGDDTVLIRLPSLIFGTAMVPFVYLLGRRVGGVRVGLLAALVITLSPFAIWYSDEARNYATMMFFVTVSTLALLEGVRGRGRAWWVLYAVTACAALWCHYTAAFVVAAGAGWVLWAHREHSREALLASGAVAVGYLPWLPGFLEQRQNDVGIDVIDKYAPVTFRTIFEVPTQMLVGHPFFDTGKLPGPVGWLLLAVVVVLAIGAAARHRLELPRLGRFLRSEGGLLTMLALATPVGLLLYAATGTSLYIPRNLSASLPALAVCAALLVAALAARAPRQLSVAAMAALVGLLVVGTVKSLGDDYRRTPFREAARYVDRVASPGDAVLHAQAPTGGVLRLPKQTLDRYFERDHPLYPIAAAAPGWRVLEDGRSVYVVLPAIFTPPRPLDLKGRQVDAPPEVLRRYQRLGGDDGRAIWRGDKKFPGIIDVAVSRFQGLVNGRLEERAGSGVISWSLGRRVTVTPRAIRGRIETIWPAGRPLFMSGWAVDAATRRPAEWVLFFYRDRLFAVSPGGVPRPDIARRYGQAAELSGFTRAVADAPVDRAAIRAFGVFGDRASELEPTPAARRSARAG